MEASFQPNRYTPGIEFDKYATRYYCSKQQQCKERGIDFNLTFTQVKNMLRAKRCQLTGVDLTHTNAGKKLAESVQRPTDVTIDRLDNNKPYETGNVIAAAHFANHFKGILEKDCGSNAANVLHNMSKNLKKRGF